MNSVRNLLIWWWCILCVTPEVSPNFSQNLPHCFLVSAFTQRWQSFKSYVQHKPTLKYKFCNTIFDSIYFLYYDSFWFQVKDRKLQQDSCIKSWTLLSTDPLDWSGNHTILKKKKRTKHLWLIHILEGQSIYL